MLLCSLSSGLGLVVILLILYFLCSGERLVDQLIVLLGLSLIRSM
jgi:hypothetical protein